MILITKGELSMSEKITNQNTADAVLEYSCLFGANKNVYRIAPSLQDGID